MYNFMSSPRFLFTSESVSEGHPDKICDQISDAVLDAIYAEDPYGRVACECAATTGLVLVLGEITTSCYVEIPSIVRETIKEIGYVSSDYGFDYQTCGVISSIHEQSPDIARGVDEAREAREGEMTEEEIERVGAGDQGMMIGYACDETPELMPMPIMLAHGLVKRLAAVRKDGSLGYLRPDGKSQVTVEYRYGRPVRVDSVVIAAQHAPDIKQRRIESDIVEHVVRSVVPEHMLDDDTDYYINSTGRFVIGGPMGDSGLTGRKIMVDTYGGMVPHGGGAFSGKDPTKVDRSASYATRWIAKNVVAAGLAERCQIQVAYTIGVAEPLSLNVETFGTGKVPDEEIENLVRTHFDLRPGAIIRDLRLRRPIYKPTAAYGHFGRTDIDAPWERTDRAEELREA
ncbi:MAG: methionine adenosyltransferase, partial [Chloroflexota bacterium]|nr:methionine adenosyltransferase [Chloroflexota bacterium]